MMPEITLEQLNEAMTHYPLIRGVDRVPKGHLRIETDFLYPDGTPIEVFLVKDKETPLMPFSKLSDLGQTTAYLLNLSVRPWVSAKRRTFLEDTLRTHRVELNGGAFEVAVSRPDELPDAIIRLAQTCLRVSDLIFTRRVSLQSPFVDQLEEFFGDAELAYEPNAELPLLGDRTVEVDFLVQGKRTNSAVLSLSSTNPSAAHASANEVFAKWYDIATAERPENRVTIFDDSHDVYRDSDLKRIAKFSSVLPFSERRQVVEFLKAA
ncbi:DUF1828 domain-containing protein [Cystobacter fuscus]|uniref:DUF1828 domain-containing protein n=1 Tax=Cystobacter fuscus TaxID=43 RepID=UPI002B2EF6A3|nr:DUF1828 domain-containing protein [Cystobacter fuscus]